MDNRSHSTPHALRCNCHVRPCGCNYSHGSRTQKSEIRRLDIGALPECRLCGKPYQPSTGFDGACLPCHLGRATHNAEIMAAITKAVTS